MNLWKSIAGMVQVEITSADLSQCFSSISSENIPIYKVKRLSDLKARIQIYRRDYGALCMVCDKRGDKITLLKRKGIYWSAKGIVQRPVMFLGIGCLLASTLMIPGFVFFVQVSGNASVPANRILEAAEECGIRFGASRREVRSEKVKNALLSKVPELQWAGVNTRGCVAVISVRERTITEEEPQEHRVSSIVAHTDGVITNCTATKGNLLCEEGQAVKAGQTLISGYVDCGISIQATRAEGEVYAQTNRELTVLTPKNWTYRTQQQDSKYVISLLIEKKRINLWKDSGISHVTCGRMYKEYYVTLPGGFRLPIALCIETYTGWEVAPGVLRPEEKSMQEFAKGYISRQMVAGTVLQSKETFRQEDAHYVLNGSYVCSEMIGREKPEKIGD